MIFILLIIVLGIAGPLYVDYAQNPPESLLVQSKREATFIARDAITKLHQKVTVKAGSSLASLIVSLIKALLLYAMHWLRSLRTGNTHGPDYRP